MTEEKDNERPWLDRNGRLIGTFKLKQISKEWTPEQWEQFLENTVDRELSKEEILEKHEELLEESCEEIWINSKDVPLATRKLIKYIRNNVLTKRQRQVAEALYWNDLGHRKSAELLEISVRSVRKIEMDLLNKFRKILQKQSLTSSYLIGGRENKLEKKQTRSQQIQEVYRMDLKGTHLK